MAINLTCRSAYTDVVSSAPTMVRCILLDAFKYLLTLRAHTGAPSLYYTLQHVKNVAALKPSTGYQHEYKTRISDTCYTNAI